MKKIDLKKEYRELYSAPAKTPVAVKVPKLNFLIIDGSGDQGGPTEKRTPRSRVGPF